MLTYLELSENDWEYTGRFIVKSKNPPEKINDTAIKVDGVVIDFDEQINILGSDF